jgi:hypothetical protein
MCVLLCLCFSVDVSGCLCRCRCRGRYRCLPQSLLLSLSLSLCRSLSDSASACVCVYLSLAHSRCSPSRSRSLSLARSLALSQGGGGGGRRTEVRVRRLEVLGWGRRGWLRGRRCHLHSLRGSAAAPVSPGCGREREKREEREEQGSLDRMEILRSTDWACLFHPGRRIAPSLPVITQMDIPRWAGEERARTHAGTRLTCQTQIFTYNDRYDGERCRKHQMHRIVAAAQRTRPAALASSAATRAASAASASSLDEGG